jgi:murein DD-endopeptidase MepM/ murein hydrolase activator NlpD
MRVLSGRSAQAAPLAALLIVLLAAAGSAGASEGAKGAGGARAFSLRILLPNQDPITIGEIEAPPEANVKDVTLAYPADGSLVSGEQMSDAASLNLTSAATAGAASNLARLSLFGGEITADAVAASANARAGPAGPSGDFDGAALTNLVVLGQPVQPAPNLRVPLGDWGQAIVLEQATDSGSDPTAAYRGGLTALDVTLAADHDGLPAGTRILVGYAEAWAWSQLPVSAASSTTATEPAAGGPRAAAPASRAARPQGRVQRPRAKRPAPQLVAPEPPKLPNGLPSPFVLPPPNLTPNLTAGGYVFPVYGPSGYVDTFGAPRPDVSYHHGDDVFAPLGAPILAVADGTVFSVGWNKLGGNRLWLRDKEGNQFYYAHLSAFSTLAVNGAHVRAGAVLGFVGNTGDAEGTPYHLHFEVHPVSLLFLGYDGAVDPTPYLDAWQHLLEIRLQPAVWAPAVAPTTRAPTPGAILLQSSDISSADGLDPGSLQRALAPTPRNGEGAITNESTGG